MSLRTSINKLILICKRNTHHTINLTHTKLISRNCNKYYFSTQQNDDNNTSQSSALSDNMPSGYINPERISSENQTETETEETKTATETGRKYEYKSKSKLTQNERYALKILNEDILEHPKPDTKALSDEEQRLYKVVQHVINEGFIDEFELLKLAEKRKQIKAETSDKFNKFELENSKKSTSFDLDEKELNKWRDSVISEMDENVVNYKNMTSNPLLINMKQFMFKYNEKYQSDKNDIFYELQLDDRDLKHILLYLIYNHLNTKRFHELNPSIKELANLLYGIKTQTDFNRLLNIMSRTRKQIINIIQSYPRQSPPNILINYDKTNDLEHDDRDNYNYDEYGHNIQQNVRDMTSFELDSTIKRIQDLEFRQYGYAQPPQAQSYDETDDEFIKLVQNEEEAETETMAKNEQIKQEIEGQNSEENSINMEEKQGQQGKKGYYSSVMEKVQQRWNGDLMDIAQVGGDWRVRLGIAERETEQELDYEMEVDKQYKRQLNESIAYTTRKRYKISPWTIKSLPFTEAKELDVNFANVKLLNKFVNDRGMILPRRFTGVDKRTQKRIAKAIKRARKIGFMPHMSKLLILEKKDVQKKAHDLYVKKYLQNEKEEYDLMNITDLQTMYPEYAPNEAEYDEKRVENKDLEINFDGEYGIDAEELIYETQLRKQQNIFMRQIKQDIIKKIPEYWQKRLSFRDKSNVLVNRTNNKQKNKLIVNKEGAAKTSTSTSH